MDIYVKIHFALIDNNYIDISNYKGNQSSQSYLLVTNLQSY
jgi:hypothetical protein